MSIKWRRILRPHNLLATAFIFLAMWVFSFIHIDHHRLDPFTYGIRDYDVTDIVYSRLRKTETILDDRIVLVNTGNPDRMVLHKMLERIEAAQPRVVGIDLFLDSEKDSLTDALLQRTFQKNNNIVLVTSLENFDEEKGYFEREGSCHPMFREFTKTGFSNFPANRTQTIRMFSPETNVQNYKARSFATEISLIYDSTSFKSLKKRGNELERIHFNANEDSFLKFEPEVVLDSAVDLSKVMKDKIVLIGYLNDFQPDDPIVDRFFTPLNQKYAGRTIPDMYGLVLHANIIRMLLDRDYVNYFPKWATFIFALALVYANTFFFFWNYKYFWYFKSFPKILYRWAHLIQVIEIALLFLLTAWIFYAYKTRIDFTVAIVGLLLAFDLCIIYYYLTQNIRILGKVPDHFPIRHRKKKTPKTVQPIETENKS